MSFWVEIRCDARETEAGCWSDKNNGPMGLGSTRRQALGMLLRNLEMQARDQGWSCVHHCWVCPACRKYRQELHERRLRA